MEWVIDGNHCLHFVEDANTRKNSNIGREISYETIKKLLKSVVEKVKEQIAADLPEKFGIIIDGWDAGNGSHRMAIYATYQNRASRMSGRSTARNYLLAVTPLLNESNFTAETNRDFIEYVLSKYGKTLSDIIFIVGDNVSCNRRIALLCGCTLVGCAR